MSEALAPVPPLPGRRLRAWAWSRQRLRRLLQAMGVALWAAWVGGLAEGWRLGPRGALACAGFSMVLTGPSLGLAVAVVMGFRRGWRTRLAGFIVDGDAHRLLAALVVGLGLVLGVGWVAFQTVWLFALATQWKPNVVAVGLGLVVMAALGAALGVAPSLYDGCRAGLAWAGARWARRKGAVLWTSRRVIALGVVSVGGCALGVWVGLVRPYIGPIALGLGPYIAGVSAVLVVRAWRGPWPWWLRVPKLGLGLLALGYSAHVWRASPHQTLAIWAQAPVVGSALDVFVDWEAARASWPTTQLAPQVAGPHPDVILVTVDTLRADQLAPWGGTAPMPNLAALAARGTVFTRAYAAGNVTRRSIPAMLIGAHAPRVVGRVQSWALKLDPRHVTLPERLRAGGYQTAGFVCCESFWGARAKTGWARGLDTLVLDRDGQALVAAAGAWLRQPRQAPRFAWLHFIDVHNWDPAAEGKSAEAMRQAYGRALVAFDRLLGQLMAAAPDAVIVLTSDHGEGLGDHGATYHSSNLFDSQIKIPLLISEPGATSRRHDGVVSLVDVMPTVLALAGFAPPGDPLLDGRSLVAETRGGVAPPVVAYAAMIKDRSAAEDERAVIEGPWKLYQRAKTLALYNLETDPGERQDVASQHPTVVTRLRQTLLRLRAREALPAFAIR